MFEPPVFRPVEPKKPPSPFLNPQFLFLAVPFVLGWLPTTQIFCPTGAPLRYGLYWAALPGFAFGALLRWRIVQRADFPPRWPAVSAAFYGLAAAVCWTVFGGGVVDVINVTPLDAPKPAVEISGTIKSIEHLRLDSSRYSSWSKHRYYSSAVLSTGFTVHLTAAEYQRLQVGDFYKTTMRLGRLGIPFQADNSL